MLDETDPLAAASDVVAGYQSVRPLSPTERDVLFPLMCGRLAVSVVIAVDRRRIDPARQQWFVSQPSARQAIDMILSITPAEARRRILRERRPTGADDVAASRLADRRRLISNALSVSYTRPIAIDKGIGQYLVDVDGRPYLDLVNNVCHVGHCHPHVVAAVSSQMARLHTNTRYLYDELTRYAERLTHTLPASLEVCFFVNSGSEANELALRLARANTRHTDVLVIDGAYHGNTTTLTPSSKSPRHCGVLEPNAGAASSSEADETTKSKNSARRRRLPSRSTPRMVEPTHLSGRRDRQPRHQLRL